MSASTTILKKVDTIIKKAFRQELREQGHYLTGGLERSINGDVTEADNVAKLEGSAANYSGILDDGTTADRVPFNQGSGAGHSKYIDGLITYFKLRGLGDKEAISAAFATAKVQKREGMPTKGSYAYSKNNERKIFIDRTEKQISAQVDTMISEGVDDMFEKAFSKQKSETI